MQNVNPPSLPASQPAPAPLPMPEPLPVPLPTSLPPGTPMLGYASPMQYTPGGQWQDGDILVMHKNAAFINCCVKCGQASDGRIWKHTYWWHHPAYIALILVGILVYAIVALCVRKSAVVELYLCERHRSKRNRNVLLTWLLALGGLGGIIGGLIYAANARPSDGWIGGVIALIGFVMLIGSMITGFALAPILRPTKIDKEYAWFKGVSRAYLAQLPGVIRQ